MSDSFTNEMNTNDFQEEKLCGIDPTRIINSEVFQKFNEILKCKICFKVLDNPYDCSRCGNSFCYECINKIKENNKICPFNCTEFNIKSSSFGIINILNSLKFSCSNKANGCEVIISYNELNNHDLFCTFVNVHCPNTNCSKLIKRKNLEFHLSHECQSSLFKCDTCKANFSRSDFLNHYQTCKIITNALNIRSGNIISSAHKRNSGNSNNLNINSNIISSFNPEEFNSYMDYEIKNLNLDNFLKILLFNLGKSNSSMEHKLDSLKEDILTIKSDIKQIYSDFNTNFNNLNINIESEIDALNDRISMLNIALHPSNDMKKTIEDSFKDMYEKIDRKTSNDTTSFSYNCSKKNSNEETAIKEITNEISITRNTNTSGIAKTNLNVNKNVVNNKGVKINPVNTIFSANNTDNNTNIKGRTKIEIGKKINIEATSQEKNKQKLNNSNNIINISQSQNPKTAANREALSPKNRSPIRTTIQNQLNKLRGDDNTTNTSRNNLIRLRERSSHHTCNNANQILYPIQTSYEAIQATLRNHELIIDYLNNILNKMDKDLAKEIQLDTCLNLLRQNLQNEYQGIKA